MEDAYSKYSPPSEGTGPSASRSRVGNFWETIFEATRVVLPCTRRKKMRCHAVTQKNVSTTTTTTLVLLAPGWPMHDAQKSAYTLLLPLLKKYKKFAKRKTRLVVSKHQRKSALLDNKNNSHFNINARWVCHKLTFPNWDWKSQLVFFFSTHSRWGPHLW